MLVGLPYLLLHNLAPPPGLKPYNAQQPRDPAQAPDMTRGWGRPSVTADYAYDIPHLLGTSRTGPDLFNIGARQPSEDWQDGQFIHNTAFHVIDRQGRLA